MNLAAVYQEMQSDFDFCLDPIKAFCATDSILGALLPMVTPVMIKQGLALKTAMNHSAEKLAHYSRQRSYITLWPETNTTRTSAWQLHEAPPHFSAQPLLLDAGWSATVSRGAAEHLAAPAPRSVTAWGPLPRPARSNSHLPSENEIGK